MLANPAIHARTGILVGRPAAFTAVARTAAPAYLAAPRAPWARHHLAFRGTRIFTALMLGWAGLILFSFGAIAVPSAHAFGAADGDAGLMALLGTVAPFIWALGVLHLVAAVGVARDRLTWGLRLATWMLAAGGLVTAGALVLALAGRDPFAFVDPAGAVDGMALITWTLGLYALAGWGLRRVLAARQLV